MKAMKFHRSRDGQIRPCSAREHECPLREHFSSPQEAARAAIADAGVPELFNTDMAAEVRFEATRNADGQVLITATDLEEGDSITYGPLRELSNVESHCSLFSLRNAVMSSTSSSVISSLLRFGVRELTMAALVVSSSRPHSAVVNFALAFASAPLSVVAGE